MNIVMLLTNGFRPDVRVYKEAVYLVGLGHQVTILCWDKDAQSALPLKEMTDGIRVIRFRIPAVAGTGYRQIGAYLKYVRECRKYLVKYAADYVHCHDLDGMMAYKLSGIRKMPYVFDMHEFYIQGNSIKKKLMHYLVGRMIRKSYYSLYENDGYLKIYPQKIIERLLPLKNYPGDYLKRLEKTPSEKLRIAYLGCVRSQIPEFTALFEACKNMEDVRVDIYGGGIDLPALKELEKKYNNVSVHGAYDGIKESSVLYQNTDVLFCGYNPNNSNYQGDAEVVKFYEAIITGTPMIMTDGIGMAEKVNANGFGVTADTRSVSSIRETVQELLSNRGILDMYSRKMLAAAPRYQWGEAVKVLETIYRG